MVVNKERSWGGRGEGNKRQLTVRAKKEEADE